MRKALATMLDDNFVIGYVAFIKSFLHFNHDFSDDFVIIDVGLSEESKEKIESYYQNVVYKQPNRDRYREVNMSKTADKLKSTYYTLDVFSYTEYDRIVFIDMDTIVLAPLDELFNCPEPFAAVKGYNAKLDELRGDINSGVFVVNKPRISEETYSDMIRYASRGHSMPDQKTINGVLRNKIAYFNKSYNVEKRMLHTRKYKRVLENIKILHFVASKPWEDVKPNAVEESYGEFEKIWWEWYER